jgi:hypothetical protein
VDFKTSDRTHWSSWRRKSPAEQPGADQPATKAEDDPANGGQPTRSETNQTPSAAGSRR